MENRRRKWSSFLIFNFDDNSELKELNGKWYISDNAYMHVNLSREKANSELEKLQFEVVLKKKLSKTS